LVTARTDLFQDWFRAFRRRFSQNEFDDIEAVEEPGEIGEILTSPDLVRMFRPKRGQNPIEIVDRNESLDNVMGIVVKGVTQ
jgi:hypothetical protein